MKKIRQISKQIDYAIIIVNILLIIFETCSFFIILGDLMYLNSIFKFQNLALIIRSVCIFALIIFIILFITLCRLKEEGNFISIWAIITWVLEILCIIKAILCGEFALISSDWTIYLFILPL